MIQSILIQSKIKSSAYSDLTFRPGFTSVAVNDSLHSGQTNPGSSEFYCFVQTLERLEEFIGIGHIESNPVIANKVGLFAVMHYSAHFNLWF